MLKVVFFTLLISCRVGRWFRVQVSMFIGVFLFSLCGLREFF